MTDCHRCRKLAELVERQDRMAMILMGAPATPEETELHRERIHDLRAELRIGRQWWEQDT